MQGACRYKLEKGLIDGSIKVADLPKLWNQGMQDYLGCTPPNDAQGVLQDVHWSAGLFGSVSSSEFLEQRNKRTFTCFW